MRRRREVLEIPEVPVTVTEHQILTRYCPVCAAYKTPRISFAGVVLGQGRIGVRLASLIGALRTSYRLPLAQIQALLAAVYGPRLSLGGLQDILAWLRRQLAPVGAAIRAQARASPVQYMWSYPGYVETFAVGGYAAPRRRTPWGNTNNRIRPNSMPTPSTWPARVADP